MNALKVGAVAAILFMVAVINNWSEPDALVLTLVIALAVCWVWSRVSLQHLGVKRSLSADRVRAGELVSEELSVMNRSHIPRVAIEVRDFSTLPGHRAGRVVNVRGRSEYVWTTNTRCTRRGRFRLGGLTITGSDPLGLFRVGKAVEASHELVVYPPPVDVSRIALPAAIMTGGRTVNRHMELSAQTISGLREYTPGDPMSRISWTATARSGSLMVKEFDPDPTSDIWILIDMNERDHGPFRGTPDRPDEMDDFGNVESAPAVLDSTEEFAVAIAGSLVERALDDGRKVGLMVNRSIPVRLDPDTGPRQWYRLFETLAVATAFGHRPLTEAISNEARRFSRNSGLIIVTPTLERSWVAPARSLVMRQVPVSAVIIDATDDDREARDALLGDLAAAHVAVTRYGTKDVQFAPFGTTVQLPA